MARYAVLGASGNCGTSLIDNLLRDAKIKAYCCDKAELIYTVLI
jgi:uncharacterized protein YbjT (DUF2867 family)